MQKPLADPLELASTEDSAIAQLSKKRLKSMG
jgi:hypothetical protein